MQGSARKRLPCRAAVLSSCLLLLACTATRVAGTPPETEAIRTFRIGSIETGYAADIPADRLARAHEHQIAFRVARLVEEWMAETGRWGGSDTARIEVDRFRLPLRDSGLAPAQTKGDDYLGVAVSVLRDGRSLATFHVEHTLGTGDRSIAENVSMDRAVENLAEAVAWSVVHELTPFEQRRAIFEVGKREQIERAIELLEFCGQLSYAEAFKFGALGKLSLKAASGVENRRLKRAFGATPERCY